jgi:hypothetical protein
MPREVVYCLVFIALMCGAMAWYFLPHTHVSSAHRLGQELVWAAGMRDWDKVKTLLDEGADPNVTELDPSQIRGHSILSFLGMGTVYPSSYAGAMLKRPSAMQQAIFQDNFDAVKMLIAHHATIGGNEIAALRICSDRPLIISVEDAAHVPLNKRSVAMAPFTAAAKTPRERTIPGTIGADPTHHYLWLSPHELILARGTPPHFTVVDLDTDAQTKLPELTSAWANQPEFDPDMLALSPDGQWLLGFGGTAQHPTWRATQVHGNGVQEWDRVRQTEPRARFDINGHPLIAWRDSTRWMEINRGPGGDAVRLRTLGSPEVQEVPLVHKDYGYTSGYNNAIFTCTDPDHAFLRGGVAVANSPSTGPQYVLEMAEFTAGPGGWEEEKRGFNVSSADQAGYTQRCVPSPDGKRLAWLQLFGSGVARDILLTDANGAHFRVVMEKLMPSPFAMSHSTTFSSSTAMGRATVVSHVISNPRAEWPSTRSLDWTPDGTKLIYWRGEQGEGGLSLLPIGADE